MTNEGTRRLILLGKRIIRYGALAGITLWVLNLVVWALQEKAAGGRGLDHSAWGLVELFMLIAAPVSCGAILWGIGWVVEGFVASSEESK